MFEKVYLSQLLVNLVLVNEFLERDEFAVTDHAIFTDSDVIAAFVLLIAHLEFVYSFDSHIHELFTLRFLEHGHYFW